MWEVIKEKCRPNLEVKLVRDDQRNDQLMRRFSGCLLVNLFYSNSLAGIVGQIDGDQLLIAKQTRQFGSDFSI